MLLLVKSRLAPGLIDRDCTTLVPGALFGLGCEIIWTAPTATFSAAARVLLNWAFPPPNLVIVLPAAERLPVTATPAPKLVSTIRLSLSTTGVAIVCSPAVDLMTAEPEDASSVSVLEPAIV